LEPSGRKPEEMNHIAHSSLLVYETEIGPPKILTLTAAVACTPMKTILDTGAESNYISAGRARGAGARIFLITIREIVEAGQTTTSAFASFTLKIGGILTQCYAYVLDDTTQFCYACCWDVLVSKSITLPQTGGMTPTNSYTLTPRSLSELNLSILGPKEQFHEH
jgi:hypothetical protein